MKNIFLIILIISLIFYFINRYNNRSENFFVGPTVFHMSKDELKPKPYKSFKKKPVTVLTEFDHPNNRETKFFGSPTEFDLYNKDIWAYSGKGYSSESGPLLKRGLGYKEYRKLKQDYNKKLISIKDFNANRFETRFPTVLKQRYSYDDSPNNITFGYIVDTANLKDLPLNLCHMPNADIHKKMYKLLSNYDPIKYMPTTNKIYESRKKCPRREKKMERLPVYPRRVSGFDKWYDKDNSYQQVNSIEKKAIYDTINSWRNDPIADEFYPYHMK